MSANNMAGPSRTAAPPASASDHRRGASGGPEVAVTSEAVEALEIEDAQRRLAKQEIPVEASGEGARLAPVDDGFRAPGMADALLREVGDESVTWATAPGRNGGQQSTNSLERAAKPSFVYQLDHCEDSTTNLNIMKKVVSKCRLPSAFRMWFVSLVMILLLATVDAASIMDYDDNMARVCPVTHDQSKRVCSVTHGQSKRVYPTDDWIATSNQHLFLEDGIEFRGPKKEINCSKQSTGKKVGSAIGAFLSLVVNLGPLKSTIGIANVSPGQRKLLSFSSLFIVISNLCWTVQLGAQGCLNLMSYVALLVGCALHGYFCCFLWQRCDNMVCISSIITCFVSITATVGAGFVGIAPFMRIGPESFLGNGIPAAVAGIFGIISTGFGIYFRIQSNKHNDGYHLLLFICAPSAVVSTGLSIYCIYWWDLKLLCYKIGIAILFAARCIELVQLFCGFWRSRAKPPENNSYNVNGSASGTMAVGEDILVQSDSGLEHKDMNVVTTGDVNAEGSGGYATSFQNREYQATDNHVHGHLSRQSLAHNDNEVIVHKEGDHPVMGSKGDVVQSDGSSECEKGIAAEAVGVSGEDDNGCTSGKLSCQGQTSNNNNVSGHIISQGMEDNGSDVVNVNGDSNGTEAVGVSGDDGKGCTSGKLSCQGQTWNNNNVSGHIISQGMEDNGSDVVNVNGDSNGTIIGTAKNLRHHDSGLGREPGNVRGGDISAHGHTPEGNESQTRGNANGNNNVHAMVNNGNADQSKIVNTTDDQAT